MSARDSLVILSTKILIKIIGIITIYFASRVFLPEYFGLITIATSLFSFFEFFADLVFRSTHLKLMSRGDEDENILYSTYFYIKIILITLVSLITFILIQVNLNGGHVENVKLLYQVIEIYFIKSILTSYNQILSNTFLSKKKIIKMQFPFIMNSISVGILKLLAVLLFNDFLLYCFALIIGEIIHLILNSYYGKKFKLKRSNMDIFKKYLKPTSILMINGFISLCLSNIGPLIFVKYYSIDMLGVYNIIKSSFSIVFIVQQALTALYIPRFSSLIAKGELKELQMRTDAYEKYMLILWGILMIFGFLVGPVIIKLFFGEFYYNNGVDLLFFLIFQAFSWGLTGLAGSVFIS
jgi:O-antigen/teichoic acid export membrane protein